MARIPSQPRANGADTTKEIEHAEFKGRVAALLEVMALKQEEQGKEIKELKKYILGLMTAIAIQAVFMLIKLK